MPSLTTSTGLTIAFEQTGSGSPLILLHAFPLCSAMWRPQLVSLASHARVIAPDLRGFGDTGPFTVAQSVETMADDVADFLDAMEVSASVVLGGLSMGGYVALAFARRHPARLRGLILADTKAEADDEAGKAARNKAIAFAQSNPASAVIDQMIPRLLGATTQRKRPEVAAEVRRLGAVQKSDAIALALMALRDRPDASPMLGHIAAPALVLVGDEDIITPPDAAKRLAEGIPKARLNVIPSAGHLANLEQPEAFTAAIREFLAGL